MTPLNLLKSTLDDLNSQLQLNKAAASSAHSQATHTESISKSRYDTLGLEQAYLAHGQTVRAYECTNEINQIKQLILQMSTVSSTTLALDVDHKHDEQTISLASIVKLRSIHPETQRPYLPDNVTYVFILPIKGGTLMKTNDIEIRQISDQSPLGGALLGKYVDECVIVNSIEYEIIEIIS